MVLYILLPNPTYFGDSGTSSQKYEYFTFLLLTSDHFAWLYDDCHTLSFYLLLFLIFCDNPLYLSFNYCNLEFITFCSMDAMEPQSKWVPCFFLLLAHHQPLSLSPSLLPVLCQHSSSIHQSQFPACIYKP